MTYSLRVTLDTWLKLSTAQGAKLPDDQKQFLDAGTLLPIANYEVTSDNHLKITFGKNAHGQPITFRGVDTWYVYRPSVQLLQNGQTLPLPSFLQTQSTTPTYAIRLVLDSWLKFSTAQGSQLQPHEKQFVKAGTILPLSSYAIAPEDHLKITLGTTSAGKQLQFQGRTTWYAYRPALQLLRNGQVIPLSPSRPPASAVQTMNAKGLRLLKTFEGLKLDAYIDAVGIWTIGYGTTTGVRPGMKITEAQAEAFLKRDLELFEKVIRNEVKVPLNDDQFSALVSFTYNVGAGALIGSTLLKLLHQKNYQAAADQLLRWNKGDGRELPGLTRRRKAERALFLGQDFTVFL